MKERISERIQNGETVRFLWKDWDSNTPVENVIQENQAVGQHDLGLFMDRTIWVFKPKKEL